MGDDVSREMDVDDISREMDALDDRKREADAPDSETDAPGMMKKPDEPGNIKQGMGIPDNIRQKLANVMFNGPGGADSLPSKDIQTIIAKLEMTLKMMSPKKEDPKPRKRAKKS